MPSNLAQYFDAVIPWGTRLAREMPLLEELAREAGREVLVPACGTGGHVVALAERGFNVLGFDADEAALDIARRKTEASASQISAAGGAAQLRQLRMEDAGSLGPVYNAAFCLGNALPGLSAPGQLLTALKGIAGALRPTGVFLTQNLNYDLRWRQKARWFPVLSGETAEEEVLLVKFADYEERFINFHAMYLARKKTGGKWESTVRTSRQLPLFASVLSSALQEAGFINLRLWGDYSRSPFDSEKSSDLLIAATRA
ncbi:MAG TPA: class I SAM-dependent methyltransferase [Terriglobia bacterium]|nr:class I SAM-dependent methyltransferase [Terriglobia bacterium]